MWCKSFYFLNPYISEFSDPQKPENVQPYSSIKMQPIIVNPVMTMQLHPVAHNTISPLLGVPPARDEAMKGAE